MDWASLTGILLALAGVLLGHGLEGGKLASLVQPAAVAIVVVGTFGAVLLQNDSATFRRGLRMLRWVFRPPVSRRERLAQDIQNWSAYARRDGMLALEQFMEAHDDRIIKKGLRMVIDGVAPDKVRNILETEVSAYEFAQRQGARIWDSAAGYAPTIGIIGAVLGLINVMENLAEPSRLGAGIAVAFVSTIYGVGLAYLLFHPVVAKLKAIISERVTQYDILTDVFHDFASGDHTRVVDERVQSLLSRA